MRKIATYFATLAIAALGQPTVLLASTFFEEEKTCPVGGEKFTISSLASTTHFGSRPDGKPYGVSETPYPLPECPSNKLVLFDDFSDTEVAKLEELLVTPEFQNIVATETTFYRAYWLAAKLDRKPAKLRNLLYVAIWQTDEKPDLRKRYFKEYLATATVFPKQNFSLGDIWREVSFVNAERELSMFDESRIRLDAINITKLQSSGDSDSKSDIEGFTDYAQKLRAAIDRNDSSAEPLDLIGKTQAAYACRDQSKRQLSAFDKEFCRRPEIVKTLKEWESNK